MIHSPREDTESKASDYIEFRECLRISDPGNFLSALGVEDAADVTRDTLASGLLTADAAKAGMREVRIRDAYLDEDILHLEIGARLTSREDLVRAAKEAYAECWNEPDWTPVGPEDAAREYLLGSSDKPDPVNMGFEFVFAESDPERVHPVAVAARTEIENSPMLRAPSSEMEYEEWLEETGLDDSFKGDGSTVPGTADIYDEAVIPLVSVRNPSPEPA